MDITIKLENTNKKIRTIWEKTADYCIRRDCPNCLLDNHSLETCTNTFIRRIYEKTRSLERIENK